MEAAETIYLDNNSTTPCAPEVLEAMLPYFACEYGNPGSPHIMGRTAAVAVERAREQLSELVECNAEEIVFTGGATESNNLVLLGLAAAEDPKRRKIVTTAIEHKSVLGPCEHLASRGFEVIRLPVNAHGLVDPGVAAEAIDERTLLVSVQSANNEMGAIQPVAQIAEIARSRGAWVHADCAQALGKIPVSVQDMDVDFASFSGHKVYGPKGGGALFVRNGVPRRSLLPLLFGGGQENGLRPGTPNVPAIVGFGEACRLVHDLLPDEAKRLAGMRDAFEKKVLAELAGVRINGSSGPRLPGTSSVCIDDVPADILIANLPQLCISEGSACTSGALGASHVLLAMGMSTADAESTIRVALGRYTRDDQICSVADALVKAANGVRAVFEKRSTPRE